MKRLALLAAAATLALAPQAAIAKPAAKKAASAQAHCRGERADLGTKAFVAKYGKRKGRGAKAAPRAAFGRCVARAAKRIRTDRRQRGRDDPGEAELETEEGDMDDPREDFEDDVIVDDFEDDEDLADDEDPGEEEGLEEEDEGPVEDGDEDLGDYGLDEDPVIEDEPGDRHVE